MTGQEGARSGAALEEGATPGEGPRSKRAARPSRRSPHAALVFALVVVAGSVASASVWWSSAIVPGQDWPQFLVFVRAVTDCHDPASPFFGTYETAPLVTPSALPVYLTAALARLLGGSIETAGRVLLTAQSLGLVAAMLVLLRVARRSAWRIVLLFAVIHSIWTVVGGFAAYATSLPWVLVGWALSFSWLTRREPRTGALLAACMVTTLLWHAIGFAQLALGFGVLWCLWRAPGSRARLVALTPLLLPAALHAYWFVGTFGRPGAGGAAPVWVPLDEALRSLPDHVFPSVPHHREKAAVLAALVAVATLLRGPRASSPTAAFRTGRPWLGVAAVLLLAHFALPNQVGRVEGIADRFAYVAVLAFIPAWELPRVATRRAVALAPVAAFAAWQLRDVAARFRAFDAETRGASALIDRLAPRETLYASTADRGASAAFGGPLNKPLIELQQYASIRKGGLPNSSFAGYGVGVVRYAKGKNPMPGIFGSPARSPAIVRFDYVLARVGESLPTSRFRVVAEAEGWVLHEVCGGRRVPRCP